MSDLTETYFCKNPFTKIEIHPNGDCYFCCDSWLPLPLGNIFKTPIMEIWNGAIARKIRKSIHDNSFQFCDRKYCQHLGNKTNPVIARKLIKEFHFLDIIDEQTEFLENAPTKFTASFDKSCNLSCPTCRLELIVESIENNSKIKIIHENLMLLLPHLENLNICGSGDPFGSPYFFSLLKSLKSSDFPKLKISLHTNALLLNEKKWQEITEINQSITSIDVSIDAASEETYSINRRNGKYNILLKNLSFISSLRKENKISHFGISFVVQANNWKEMSDFVELGKKYEVDQVIFTRLKNWGTFSEEEFHARSIHESTHPEHHHWKSYINQNKIFKSSIVNYSNLSDLFENSQ